MQNPLLVIGMSPGNSYFKQEAIDKLLVFGLEKYEKIGIFIPDVPAVSTYVALGYPENVARREKAIPQGNSFRNRINRSINDQNLNINKIRIFDWRKEEIEENVWYKDAFKYVSELYQNNSDFKKDINLATEAVLVDNPFRKKDIVESDIEIGTHYILSEFAFIVFLPDYLKEHDSFIYGYHHPWPAWEKFIAGAYDNVPKTSLQFLLLPNFS